MRTRRGFTLIELLITVAIISMLAGAVYVAMSGAFFESQDKAAKGLIGSLRIALEGYRGQFRAYPPDGFDYEVRDHMDRPIQNSACLIYFLTRPVVRVTRVGTERLLTRVGPFMRPIRQEYLSGDLDGPDGNLVEILDPWLNPLNYDDLGHGFTELGGLAVHTMPNIEDYNVDLDPREGEPRGSDLYNLWSNGRTNMADPSGEDVPEPIDRFADNITNWESF